MEMRGPCVRYLNAIGKDALLVAKPGAIEECICGIVCVPNRLAYSSLQKSARASHTWCVFFARFRELCRRENPRNPFDQSNRSNLEKVSFSMRQTTIRRLSTISHRDFFGINDITNKDVAGAFSSGTKLSTEKIEKKYNPLMGARIRLLNEEKDKNMTYGTIRMDLDNQTLKHGQYEPEKTERLYQTIELKQRYVPDDAAEQAQVETQAQPSQPISTSSIPNMKPELKISEVKPFKEIGEVLATFKREGDEKATALKYKNTPPLTFYFGSASEIESQDTSHTEIFSQPLPPSQPRPPTIIKSKQREQRESKSKDTTPEPSVRRPQMDLDAQAGPEGARAPIHELHELSLELADRQGELKPDDSRFDRSVDQKFDVIDEEPAQPMKALEYIKKVRDKQVEPQDKDLKKTLETREGLFPLKPTIKLDSHGFRNYTYQVPDWTKVRRADVIGLLRGSIIYNNYDILAINKPYGIASHANPTKNKQEEYDMNTLVGEMAKSMRIEKVFLAHRLDKTTSGLLIFATSQERARDLNKLFKADEIKKTYLCITRGVPDPRHGIIDMPIGEIEVAGKLRSCPAPYDLEEKKQLSRRYREARRAITEYRVIDSKRHVALVELRPQSGVKHQLRCHMSFGLKTPILGDHKYSHLHKLAPQTLAPSILKAFHLRQSKVRTLPMHLHAKSIVIPGAKANGETLFIDAPLPQHFVDNMKALKLSMNNL